MPPIEIVAVDRAPENEVPTTFPASERKIKRPRYYALSFTDHLRLLLPFLVAGTVGMVARLKYPYWWPANDLVYFLADSFIVAMVLGVALDLFSARLLVERVSDSVAQRLIGRGLPAELQAPIRDVVGTDLVRDHYVKSYAFSPPKDGYVEVYVEVRYEVRNYSEAVRDYAPELSAEVFLQPRFRFLEYGIPGRKIYTFSDDSLTSKVQTVDELNVMQVPGSALPPISLNPVRSGEKAACKVTWRYGVTLPDEFCDVTNFDEATLGATFQVEAPEELEFVTGGDASLHHEAGSQSWYFEKAFISGQHVRAWWFRRKPSMRSSRPTVR
jgi:hypothetical protein